MANWWDEFEDADGSPSSSVTVKLPPATKATPKQEKKYGGVSREEVRAQRTLDATPTNDTWGHFMDVISNDLGRGLASFAPYAVDVAHAFRPGFMHNPEEMKQALLGQGPLTSKVNQKYSNVFGEEAATTPAERYGGAVAQGVGASLFPVGEIAGFPRAVAAGASGGASAELASELFPDTWWAPVVAGFAGGFGPAGIEHGFRKAQLGHEIRAGMRMPGWQNVNNVILGLEGGGSEAHPDVSPAGAVGPQQVMMATARNPGFHIRPWDGKTQADLARVGRQYSAVMMRRYGGDPAKVLAAYNGGPGMVDHLVSKYGADWQSHIPTAETHNYVNNGLRKLGVGEVQGPETLGPVDIVGNEQPSVEQMAMANQHLRPSEFGDIEEQARVNQALRPREPVDITNEINTPTNSDLDNSLLAIDNPNDFHDAVMNTLDRHPDWMPSDALKNRFAEVDAQKMAVQRSMQNFPDANTPADQMFVNPAPNPIRGETAKGGWEGMNAFYRMLKDEGGALRGDDNTINPHDTPEEKLMKAVKQAQPATAETRRLAREEKGKRFSNVNKIQQEGLGLAGLKMQNAAMKGKLPKADFESLAHHFTEEDINHLLNKINFSNSMTTAEKLNAQNALAKLLGADGAKIPNPSDIKLLSRVYGDDFIKALMSNRPFVEKFWRAVGNTLNIPRSIMSSYDLSAPLRQGIGFIGYANYWKSFGNMFKLFGSEEASKALMDNIHSRPTWELMQKGGLAISDPHSHFIGDREEMFPSDYAEKIPIAGLGVKASNRAYSGFLNKLRADMFDQIVRDYENAGINVATDTNKLKEIANHINTFSGRGTLSKNNPIGKNIEAAIPIANSVLFSPRLMISRVKMLSPTTYIKSDPILRKHAIYSAMTAGASALGVLAMAKYVLGLDVSDDPTSADFLKIKVGNTRYDIGGGFQQYLRLGAQLYKGMTTNSHGEHQSLTEGKFGQPTRKDIVVRFLSNKLAPIPSAISDWLQGSDATGKKFNVKDAVANRMIPMFVQDVADVYKDQGGADPLAIYNDPSKLGASLKIGGKAAAMASPGVFGVGVQTYKPRPRKAKGGGGSVNFWDEFEAAPKSKSNSSDNWWKDFE